MKKIVAFAALSAVLFSCSNNDDSNAAPDEEPFFSFKVGDVWAYRNYNQNHGGTFVPTTTDTVKIIGTLIFNGKTYFDFETTSYMSGQVVNSLHTYQRVNEDGHLVNQNERVLHPGSDTDFTDHYPFTITSADTLGFMATRLYALQDVDVEGAAYSAYKYESYYTPNENGGAEGVGYQTFYSPGVGLVLSRDRYLTDADIRLETRLIYHK
ncbi:hypothetical protein [Flavobacterium psychrotrophum]|uniref:hypothetical protein n=1 Tax=Flavobacterium psychrotrophum TaxID=2294119 RepID=UPI000E316BD1|nr:hypothetical protein [Flavobacterium psychrotrophum]